MTEFTLSLPELFSAAQQQFTAAMDSGTVDSDSTALADIEAALSAVQSESIFSKNEDLEDIPTSSIKYLYLRHFLGMVHSKVMTNRLSQLQLAKVHLTTFLEACQALQVLHEDEIKAISATQSLGPEERRRTKIEKYKRHKENKERLQSLTRLMFLTKEDTEFDHEEELRTMAVLQLQMYAQESLDELNTIDQEIPIALHMQELERQQEMKGGGRPGQEQTQAGYVTRSEPPKPGEGPGLKVVRMMKMGDEITTKQETIKAGVFKPHLPPPTMTLQEFGRLEMEDAIARGQREQEAAARRAEEGPEMSTRRYNQLYADGDEDDIHLVEQATINDRNWDDWKDHNPRGSGNKANKRY